MIGKGLALVLVLTLIVGVAGGLVVAWLLVPVEYVDSAPDSLHPYDKLAYLTLIGDLYVPDRDVEWASARLAELGVEVDGAVLASYVESHLESGGRPEDVRNLAQLAKDLGASGGVLQVFGTQPGTDFEQDKQSELSASVSPEPEDSPTPVPSITPSPAFRLVEQTAFCGQPGQPGRINVWVRDDAGAGVPGMQLAVTWAMGQDRFFTGLRPVKGTGFADFEIRSGVKYDVALVDYPSDVAEGLFADLIPGHCPTNTIAIDWRLVFQQSD
jgi:hypothetical protein